MECGKFPGAIKQTGNELVTYFINFLSHTYLVVCLAAVSTRR